MHISENKKKQIEKLLDKMQAEYDYEIVPVIPEVYAEPLQCYNNVDEKVKRDGGKIHYGWSIHFNNKYGFIEAERHAVWENNNQDLICITPNVQNNTQILFISNNISVDRTKVIDNFRVNMTDNIIVDDIIFLWNTIGQIKYKYYKIVGYNQQMHNNKCQSVIFNLEQRIHYLSLKIKDTRIKCFCNKGKKYIDCHHNKLKQEVKLITDNLDEIMSGTFA